MDEKPVFQALAWSAAHLLTVGQAAAVAAGPLVNLFGPHPLQHLSS